MHSLLNESFPVVFENGHRVETLSFWCTDCRVIASPDQVYGHVSRLTSSAVDVWATYECVCGRRQEYRIRLQDNRSYMYLDESGWHCDTTLLTFRKRVRLRLVGGVLTCFLALKSRGIANSLRQMLHNKH